MAWQENPPGEKIGVKRMRTHEARKSSGLSKHTRGSTLKCAHASRHFEIFEDTFMSKKSRYSRVATTLVAAHRPRTPRVTAACLEPAEAAEATHAAHRHGAYSRRPTGTKNYEEGMSHCLSCEKVSKPQLTA